jgi:hypothetical protein
MIPALGVINQEKQAVKRRLTAGGEASATLPAAMADSIAQVDPDRS